MANACIAKMGSGDWIRDSKLSQDVGLFHEPAVVQIGPQIYKYTNLLITVLVSIDTNTIYTIY
jgi:hypothetical protein